MGRHDGLTALPATLAGREAPPRRTTWVRWVPVAALAATAFVFSWLVVGALVPTAPVTTGLDAPLVARPTAAAPTTPEPAPPAAPSPTGVQAELIDLAGRLPTGVRITAPAGWARWAGARPTYARDVDGCPHVSRRLGAALGGRWTYVYGTMPQDNCIWMPVPWNPKQPADQRFTFAIGFRQGDVPRLLQAATGCSGPPATLAVPDVAAGARLSGCADAAGARVRLALPDAGGTGVWFLEAASGTDQHGYAPAAALPALVQAASAWFG